MNSMKNQGIETKMVTMGVPGGRERKKGGPKIKVYPVRLMKTKDLFFTALADPVMYLKNKPLIELSP